MYEELIVKLHKLSNWLFDGGFPASSRTARESADALENQQREIEALKQIIEKQAGLNQKLADMALELDTVKAERDVLEKQFARIAAIFRAVEAGANGGVERRRRSEQWRD